MVIQADALADTVPVACARLGISRSSCYIQLAQGNLRAKKVGGRTLISRAAQAAWLDSLPDMRAPKAA